MALFLSNLAGGGAERVTLNLIEGLIELGCSVDIVLLSAVGELLGEVPQGVDVIDLGCGRALRAPAPLARYLRRYRPDVLIGTEGHTNLAALVAKRIAGAPTELVFTEHLAVSDKPKGMKDRIYRLLARLTYGYAKAVVAVSGGVADSLVAAVGLPRDAVTVIYNPVLTKRYWETVSAPVEDPWFSEGQPPVVLGVGRLVAQKDFPTLIKAFKHVRASRDARLMILGDGTDRPALEGLVNELGLSEHVKLPGFVAKPASYMARSAVFALSSVREGLPTVLIEALATEVPIVATDCESGPDEILRSGRLGRLVPVGDARELGEAIISALDEGRSAVSREDLEEYFPEAAAKRYLQVAGHLA